MINMWKIIGFFYSEFWIESLQKRNETDPKMVEVCSGAIQDIREKFLNLIAWNPPIVNLLQPDYTGWID